MTSVFPAASDIRTVGLQEMSQIQVESLQDSKLTKTALYCEDPFQLDQVFLCLTGLPE